MRKIFNIFGSALMWMAQERFVWELVINSRNLCEVLRQHVARAAEKLHKQNNVISAVMVFVRTKPFRTDLLQYLQRMVVFLERATDDSWDMIAAVVQRLRRIWRYKRYAYYKAGLILLNLSPKANRQLTLIETLQTDDEAKRSGSLMATMVKLNREHCCSN